MAFFQGPAELQESMLSQRESAAGAGGVATGQIVGICFGGAALLLVLLTPLAIIAAKKMDGMKAKAEAARVDEEQIDFNPVIQTAHPPQTS